jgi:hypothetical protein
VTVWRHARALEAWAHGTGRDGEQGPGELEIVTRRVPTRLARTRTGPDEWLVVTRHPRAEKSTVEGHAAPDAGDQDAYDG